MKIKGIFFDLFGTLLIYNNVADAWSDWLSVFYKCLKNYGLQMSKKSFATFCDGFFGKSEPPAQNDRLTVYERRIQVLTIDLGLQLERREIQHTAISCINAWEKYVTRDPNAIPVLQALKKNKTLALISNYDHPPHIYSLLSDMALYGFFDSIVISGDVGVKKPDPRIFSIALQQTNLRSNEVVYVGDTLEDIQGARAAGISPILIQRIKSSEIRLMVDFYLKQKSPFLTEQKSTIKGIKTISKLLELNEMFL